MFALIVRGIWQHLFDNLNPGRKAEHFCAVTRLTFNLNQTWFNITLWAPMTWMLEAIQSVCSPHHIPADRAANLFLLLGIEVQSSNTKASSSGIEVTSLLC